MKKIGLFVLCVVFILLFGYTICSFGSSEIYSFDSPKNLYSEFYTYVYNEKISEHIKSRYMVHPTVNLWNPVQEEQQRMVKRRVSVPGI